MRIVNVASYVLGKTFYYARLLHCKKKERNTIEATSFHQFFKWAVLERDLLRLLCYSIFQVYWTFKIFLCEVGVTYCFPQCSSMCFVSVQCALFTTFCTPLFRTHLWFSFRKSNLRKLIVAYIDTRRLLLQVPRWYSSSYLFVFHSVPTFEAVLRKL